jgi:hypothetical protein
MPHFTPVRATEEKEEIFNELVLRLLRQFHKDQFEIRFCRILPGIVDKSRIASEAKVVFLARKPIQPTVVQPLKPKRKNRFDIVSFVTKSLDKFARQVLVEEYSHAAWEFSPASSRKAF